MACSLLSLTFKNEHNLQKPDSLTTFAYKKILENCPHRILIKTYIKGQIWEKNHKKSLLLGAVLLAGVGGSTQKFFWVLLSKRKEIIESITETGLEDTESKHLTIT